MGGESQPTRVRAAGAPTRCPYCHEEVQREGDLEWVACRVCLAPHHAECWSEGAGCAACGDQRPLAAAAGALAVAQAREPASEQGAGACLELELRGRQAHFEGGAALDLFVRPGGEEPFRLRVHNLTGVPQRVELRDLPPGVRVEGEPARTLAPDEGWPFELTAVDAAIPWAAPLTRDDPLTQDLFQSGRDRRELVLACAEDARTIRLELAREAPSWALALGGVAVGLGLVPCLGLPALALAIPWSKSGAPEEQPGEAPHELALRRRRAQAQRRVARWLSAWSVLGLAVFVLYVTYRLSQP
ncbi:MAG: hypothetical protein AB7N76_33890 [Planctomycetota bacterium]